MGIEPTQPAWKAGILPLNNTRRCASNRSLKYHITPMAICQVHFSQKKSLFYRKTESMCTHQLRFISSLILFGTKRTVCLFIQTGKCLFPIRHQIAALAGKFLILGEAVLLHLVSHNAGESQKQRGTVALGQVGT